MIQSVIIIGAILTIISIVVGVAVTKVSGKEKFTGYYPIALLGIIGILLACAAPIVGKVEMMGAGLGGWGIAVMFAAAIGFIVTSLVDSYANVKA
jgi:FtsH-binding integral membrane protein